jgi:hypothetical protein
LFGSFGIEMTEKSKCPACGSLCDDVEGPNHKYFGESPGCWNAYGQVLTREFENRDYWPVHRLTVDAYAAQHPFCRDRRNVQSVNIHLLALYAIFEKNVAFDDVPKLLDFAARNLKDEFEFLEPPLSLGEINVANVLLAPTAEEHCRMVWLWARSVWQAWSPRHREIEGMYLKICTV